MTSNQYFGATNKMDEIPLFSRVLEMFVQKMSKLTLRKTLFQIMAGLIKRSPIDNPVYAFMDKKRAQGKPYYVYMTDGANKFLRIYYGRVNEYLSTHSDV